MSLSSEEKQSGNYFKVDLLVYTYVYVSCIVNYHCLIQFSRSRWVNELRVYPTSANEPSDDLSMYIFNLMFCR